MTVHYRDDQVTLHAGDCLDVLRDMPDNTVDAVVTDPPYGLEFMGREWDSFGVGKRPGIGLPDGSKFRQNMGTPSFTDAGNPTCRNCKGDKYRNGPRKCSCEAPDFGNPQAQSMRGFQAWCETWAAECLRVLRPGGHMLAFGGTRTWHRLTCAVEDAGFEIRDSIAWLYGSGFPKSLDVSKAIDRAAGAEREVTREAVRPLVPGATISFDQRASTERERRDVPVTDEAKKWAGFGTSLKPAHEPIVVARKPLAGTVAANVLAWGVGALNVDGCRVGTDGGTYKASKPEGTSKGIYGEGINGAVEIGALAAGRWPTNVVLDTDTAQQLDRENAVTTSQGGEHSGRRGTRDDVGAYGYDRTTISRPTDSGGPSRFFPVFRYEAKAPTVERPLYWTHSCDCEDPWPTPMRSTVKATDATTEPGSSSTSKPGNGTTGDPFPTDTTFITSTATSSTTTPTTSYSSPQPSTSAFTPGANFGTVSGGSPAASVESSSPSRPTTGTSPLRGGPHTADADRAISLVWSATSVCGNCDGPSRREAHPTTKPLDLMRWLVRLVTPPGGLVLDPFAGSGTTGEACIVEGMRAILIERELAYLPLIVARLTKPIQPDLFGGAAEPEPKRAGRWPPNVVLGRQAAEELDRQSGTSVGSGAIKQSGARAPRELPVYGGGPLTTTRHSPDDYGDSGGASRFFPIFDDPDEPGGGAA